MDFPAFKAFYEGAQPFISLYNSRERLIQAQCIQLERERAINNVLAVEIISQWITENTIWIQQNEDKFNKCIEILALPRYDVIKLFEVYKEIYGDTEVR